jgi:chromosome segregation ATPase
MMLFIILGVVVLVTFVVLGALFFMLGKEGEKKDATAVPVTDLDQLKKEFSSEIHEGQTPKVSTDNFEIIPPFEPKVSLPTQKADSFSENDTYKKHAQELEDELRAITVKADGQSNEAKDLIETLTKENESLKIQQANLELAQQKLIEVQGEASNLKTENINLQTRLESADAKVHFLEQEMAAVKIQMGDEISLANATVSELNREKESFSPPLKLESDQALTLELENLKSEHIQLRQKCEDLERTHQKLHELNGHLIEKNDLLQYELIKARAQSSGLERVSFNYKNQLEDFLKKVNTVQTTNDHLYQVKNRLEGMVSEVKLQNEELVKKDQLTQFELEKNRSRLVSLEREYEDFKARAQQKNQ